MTEPFRMALALVAGLALGALFFYGLWLTVRLTLASRVPALWVLGSFWLRAGSAVAGFYYVGRGGDWRALLACLLGFVAARYLVAAGTRPVTPPTLPPLTPYPMHLSSDEVVFWQHGFVTINLTLVTTWGLMLLMVGAAAWGTRHLKTGLHPARWQCALELIVSGINTQIEQVGLPQPARYISFIGTLFLFIALANFGIVLPDYQAPTGSLSTTVALALAVFLAVPAFSISQMGLRHYLKTFVQPTFIMLPFNLITDASRTLALAVRLFGNIMSGGLIVAILLSIAPLFFPVLMSLLGLLTGMVQAYIFAILATVYIAAAVTKTPAPEVAEVTAQST